MPDALVENPIINSPFVEPKRHFVFNDEGITNQVENTRRSSSFFVPIPKPKKKDSQQVLFKPSGRKTGFRKMISLTVCVVG